MFCILLSCIFNIKKERVVLSPAFDCVGVVFGYDEKNNLIHLVFFIVNNVIIILMKIIVNISSVYKLWKSNYMHIGISEHELC